MSSQSISLIAGTILLVLGLCAGSASSAEPPESTDRVLILPVADLDSSELLVNNASAALRNAGLSVATAEDAEAAGFASQQAAECMESDKNCSELLRLAPATWVLLLQVRRSGEGADADQSVTAKLFAAYDGSLLQVEQRHCQRCSSRERLAHLTSELVAEVANAELARQATETYINVSSTPANAILSIDGAVVGPTGQSYRVNPGRHQIKVEFAGYRPASQNVTVAANEHKTLTIGLGHASGKARSSTARRVLTWSGIGAGAVLLGVGANWIVQDGHSIGDGPAPQLERDTMTLGISSMVAGTILLGAGITLLLTDNKESKTIHMSAAPTSDGISVALGGHF